MNSQAYEGLGYPTQKPVALLERMERIVATSSNEGDVVLDPFCGCGTTIDAAPRLKREWIGIDVTHLAIALICNRLDTAFSDIKYKVVGEPEDLAGAHALADSDPYQFQGWALHLVGARPVGEATGKTGKKCQDRGPTAEMRREARSAGKWKSETWHREYDRIQIITVEDAFGGKRVEYPGQDMTLQAAPTAKTKQVQLTMPGSLPHPRDAQPVIPSDADSPDNKGDGAR